MQLATFLEILHDMDVTYWLKRIPIAYWMYVICVLHNLKSDNANDNIEKKN
jgi:hypothetical protein